MTITCLFCDVIFRHIQSLNRHIKTFHPSEAQKVPSVVIQGSLVCTVCKSKNTFKCKSDFMQHLSSVHNVTDSYSITKSFDCIEDFRSWKVEMEQKTGTFYILARKAQRKDYQAWDYECNRSGYYTPKGVGLRRLKKEGSVKISGYCPSGLKLTVWNDGKCEVVFFKKHWGHAVELEHLSPRADAEHKRNQNQLQVADPDGEPPEPQYNVEEEEAGDDSEEENLLAEMCDDRRGEFPEWMARDEKNLLEAKRKFATLCKNIQTLVENSTSVEEVSAAIKLVASIPHAVAAVRESSGTSIKFIKLVLQENSNKRKVEPQTRFSNVSCSIKRAKTEASQPISKP